MLCVPGSCVSCGDLKGSIEACLQLYTLSNFGEGGGGGGLDTVPDFGEGDGRS